MTAKPALCLLIAVAMGALTACGAVTGKRDAETVAANVFEALRSRDFDRALEFYSPRFFERTPRGVWLKALGSVGDRLGSLESYELVEWNTKRRFGATGSGTYYQLAYKVLYSKNSATEVLLLFRPLLGGDIKVVGHRIDSDAFFSDAPLAG